MRLKKYQTIFENSMSLFLLKAIDLVLTIGLIPFLIQKVGLHNYGIYAFVMSLVLFFVNVLNYGFNLSTVREVARNRDNFTYINHVFNQVFSVKLLLFASICALFLLLIVIVPFLGQYKLLFLFCSFLLVADLFSVRWLFYGLEKMKYITLISLLGNGLYVILVFSFIKIESDFVKIPLYESIGLGLVTFLAFLLVVKKYKFRLNLICFSEVVKYLKLNFSSFINLLLPSTYNLTIVFVVGLLGVPVQVSFIQLGVKFTAVFSTLVMILSNVFYPIINRNVAWMHPMRTILVGLGLLLSVTMFVFSEFMIETWLSYDDKNDFLNTVAVVRILSVIPFLTSIIAGFGVNGLLVSFKDIVFSKLTAVSTGVMILSAAIFVPMFPVFGGAFAFLLGKIIYAILVYWNYRKLNF